MKLAHRTRVATVALACALAGQAFGQTAASTVTIRSIGPLPRAVQDLLTKFGQSESVVVAEGADPFAMLRSRCGGSVTNDYIEDVQKLNPGFLLGSVSKVRSIDLPPCVRVAKNVQVTILPGDKSVDSITRRLMGVPAQQNISVCENKIGKAGPFSMCNLPAGHALGALNGGKLIEPKDLVVGKKLTAPTATWPTTILLKPGVDAKAIANQVSAGLSSSELQPGVEVAVEDADLRIIAPLTSDDAKIVGTACEHSAAATAVSSAWPFNAETMKERLATSTAIAAERKFLGGPAVIRVADTGFRGIGTFFPLSALEVNRFDKAGQPYDLDNNSYVADVYGFDAENRGNLEPYPDDRYRDHGTGVASMALGGQAMRDAAGISPLIKLSFSKIYWKRTGRISVKNDTIYQTMTHIENHGDARVVNLSVGSVDRSSVPMFVSTLRAAASQNLLVVIAAGNDSNDISEVPTFPAAHGGQGSEVAERIITVGALAPNGTLAPFSNYSQSRVDILAPGCRIPFSFDGPLEMLHGTSMAAPIVSYIAGTLHSLGIRDMTRVKQRILASADLERSLQAYTRLGGLKINPVRAVSIFDDAIRMQGETLDRYWTWRMPSGTIQVCASGLSINPRRLLSLSTYTEGGKTRVRILKSEFDNRTSDPIDCEAAGTQLEFENEAGEGKSVELQSIAVLVPRYPFLSN